MAIKIEMPKLSDTMTEGVLVEWLKKEGDLVKSGDIIAEVETDKATMEVEVFDSGVLLKTMIEKGSTVKLGEIIAIIGQKDEDISALLSSDSPKIPVSVEDKQKDQKPSVDVVKDQETSDQRIKISPLARSIAKQNQIEISSLLGSGPGGRIVQSDVEKKLQEANSSKDLTQQTSLSEEASAVLSEAFVEPFSPMRKAIAQRLSQSKFTAPHFYLQSQIVADNLVELYKAKNKNAQVKISYNDILIKIVAQSLQNHPKINVSLMDQSVVFHPKINIAIAVATKEGLVTPVILDTPHLSLEEIALKVNDLATRAAEKKLKVTELENSTFCISNLGMYGIDQFTAIINPPNSAILAIGALKETAIVKEGEIKAGYLITLTLSCDHRVIDGAIGASFLAEIKKRIEQPLAYLLD